MTVERIRTLAESAAAKKHGTRSRYASGCRCDECRAANTLYVRKRKRRVIRGDVNPLVEAAPVKEHLESLRKAGIGSRTVAEYSKIARTAIREILSGEKTTVRKKTADALLAVDKGCIQDGTLVRSVPTRKRIAWLLSEGFTRKSLAQRLGYKNGKMEIARGKTVKARTEAKVRKLHDMLRQGE